MSEGSLLRALARRIVRRFRGTAGASGIESPEYRAIERSGLFDAAEYLRLHPDVSASGIDPLAHYVRHGAAEGRAPGGIFDAKYYLDTYPDVAKAGVNPLLHYVVNGWREMRNPSSDFDTGWYWLMHMRCRTGETTPLSHFLQSMPADGVSIAPSTPLSAEDRRGMLMAAQEAIASGELDVDDYASLARYLERNAVWDGAELACRKILSAAPSVLENHLDVVRLLGIQGKHWQKVEVLSAARAWHDREPTLHFQLAMALQSMNRYAEAATAFASAVALEPGNAEWHYRLGFALEKAGDETGAMRAYGQACALDAALDAKKFGIGVFHEKFGFWREASEAYGAALASRQTDAQLHFRHGVALERCFDWESAIESFRNAAALGQEEPRPQWHYRIGYVLERLERFEEAADAYAWAITQSDRPAAYWDYRRGYVLAKAGRYQEATEAYLRMSQEPVWDIAAGMGGLGGRHAEQLVRRGVELLEAELGRDFQDAEKHFRLGLALRRLGEWERAAVAHADAVDRSERHVPKYHYALGRVLVHLKKFEQACAAFAGYYLLQRPHGVKIDVYRKNAALFAGMQYCEYMETLPVRQKVIVYDSYNGGSPSCNPYAIFLYLLDNPDYGDWLHVWAVKDRSLIPRRYLRHKNVVFADRNSTLYRRYLATASHLISNTTLPPWFIRRPGQKYMNTWHGTPLKTLGRDMRGRFLEHKTFTRNLLHATHVISPNPHTTDVIAKRHDINGIYSGMIAETGYPRIDLTIAPRDGRQDQIRKRLGIAPGAKVILYAPTWRGTHGAIRFDVERLLADMAELARFDIHLLFRGHALIEGIVSGLPGRAVVPGDIDTNELLGIVDVLITDYSSIFFDFIPTGRPILFYAYDLEEYESERGLYFEMQDMPGVLCRDMAGVVRELAGILESPTMFNERSASAAEAFCPREDGGSTRRAVSFFMDDDVEYVVREPARKNPSVLMYAGDFLNNGITSSFLNLLGGMVEQGYLVTVGLEHANVEAQPIRMEKFSQVPESVQRITRIGGMVLSPEEKWVVDLFNKKYSLPSHRAWDVYLGAYAREHRRIFGYAHFDSSVQFEGFLRFWASLFASEAAGVHKAIYLHSDMLAEYTVRFPHLRAIFELYPRFDTLVSVSRTIRDINAEKLSALCHVPEDHFAYCMNAMDADHVLQKSLEPLDEDLTHWIAGRYCFVTMGRLSPEKDHAKLIRAFASIREQYPDTAMVIAGDGPLAYDLAQLVDSMGLGGQVLMAGPRSNPFPLLRAAGCFVLSSNHEGQPMVLLEAMVLGKPIVATDIAGSRDLLAGGKGLLVPNSAEGLADGMAAAIAGSVQAAAFDAKAYQDQVMDRFAKLVVGNADGRTADAAAAHDIH